MRIQMNFRFCFHFNFCFCFFMFSFLFVFVFDFISIFVLIFASYFCFYFCFRFHFCFYFRFCSCFCFLNVFKFLLILCGLEVQWMVNCLLIGIVCIPLSARAGGGGGKWTKRGGLIGSQFLERIAEKEKVTFFREGGYSFYIKKINSEIFNEKKSLHTNKNVFLSLIN